MINTKLKLTQPVTSVEIASAIKKSEQDILKFIQNIHRDLYVLSRNRFDAWQFPLYYYDDSLIRYNTTEFLHLNPLQKHLEILRAEAEAYLVHQNLGYCEFSSQERNLYLQRAAGILPDNEQDRFNEILTCPGFRPTDMTLSAAIENFYNNIELFKQTLQDIKKEFGQSTALALGLLIQSGVKTASEFNYYGQILDLLLQKIINLPQIHPLLKQRYFDESFSNQLIFLSTLREQILKYLPHRKQDEQNIFLTDILKPDWGNSPEIAAAEIIFTALDGILLGRLGFDTNCVFDGENIYLEIITSEKMLYWQSLSYAPLSYYAPLIRYRGDFLFLISQTFSKMANRYLQSYAQSHMGRNLDKAIDLLQKAINLIPDIPTNYVDLSRIYIKGNNPKKAIQYLQKAIEIKSDAYEYYQLLGVAYCLVQDWGQAISAFRNANSLKPNNIEALNNLGYCYEQIGELDKAQDIYRRILSLEPNYFQGNFGLGNVYYALKQYELAIYYYTQALKLNSQSEHCFYNLARAYYENGDVKKSIEMYRKLLQLNPNHAAAWHNLGIIYRDIGREKEAVKCIEQACRLNPNLMK